MQIHLTRHLGHFYACLDSPEYTKRRMQIWFIYVKCQYLIGRQITHPPYQHILKQICTFSNN